MGNKKQKPAKKHHTLPKSYLKRFGDDDKVWILNFLNEHNKSSYQVSIVKASVIKDFNTVETINKRDRDFVEQKYLSKVESHATPIIDKILKTKRLPFGKEWDNLAFFIALMFLRGPWFREMIHKHFANKFIDTFSSEDGFLKANTEIQKLTGKKQNLRYKQLSEARKYSEITFDIPRNDLILKMMELIPNWADYFCKMTPNLLFIPFINEARFITSDAPVIPCYRKDNPPKLWIRSRDTDIYFPLSSQDCLVLNYDEKRKVSEASRKKIAFINRLLADKCTRILISKNKDFIWMRDNRTVSYTSDELVKFLGEKKKAQSRIKNLVEEKWQICKKAKK